MNPLCVSGCLEGPISMNCGVEIDIQPSNIFTLHSCTSIKKWVLNLWRPRIWSRFNGTSQLVQLIKNLSANEGDAKDDGLIPGSLWSPGGENGNPHQYSCLENSMDRGAWRATVHGVTKSQPQLSTHAATNLWNLNMWGPAPLWGWWNTTETCPESVKLLGPPPGQTWNILLVWFPNPGFLRYLQKSSLKLVVTKELKIKTKKSPNEWRISWDRGMKESQQIQETGDLIMCVCVLSHSVMSDSATLWDVAHQAPLSIGFL